MANEITANLQLIVKKGFLVIAPDLSGIGEMGDTRNRFVNKFEPMLIGRSVVGIRAGDVVRIVQFLKNRQDVKENEISAKGAGEVGHLLWNSHRFIQLRICRGRKNNNR